MQGVLGGNFTKVLFKNNQALKSGGAIYADTFDNLTISGDCQFFNNYAGSTFGDAINAQNSFGVVSINQSVFTAS